MTNRVKNVVYYKRPAFWLISAAAVAAVVATIFLFAYKTQTLELPETASVFTVEMEQFNDRISVGRVVITYAEQIETILSAMAGAKKTLRHSVNDYPEQDNYLVVRLIMENEMRTLCLYSEGGSEYIEEPYAGIYKTQGNSSKALYQVYTDNMEKSSGNAINIRWEAPGDVPQPVRDYAADYVGEQVEYYNSLGYNITDAKITAMSYMNTGTSSLTKAVEMWRLEYRLLPDDAGKVVLAGGMKMEDGWLTEWGSTGQPLLVLVHDWDSKSEIWRKVGVFNTLGVQEEYQGNYTAAAMALYHDFISKTGIAWEFSPKSSVFPALPIRIDMPFGRAHVSIDRGTLWLNDEMKTPNYTDCGKEADYPAGKAILWSPAESGAFDSGDVANGCILRFEITADDGKVYKGTILVDQSEKTENGVWHYRAALAETDAGLVLAESGEAGGGCALKLPDESYSAVKLRVALEPPLLTPDMSVGIGVIPDYEGGDLLIFHGYFGLFVYDLKAEKITFAADLEKAVGTTVIQGSEGAAVRVSTDGNTIQLYYYPERGKPKMTYTIDARTGSYTYGEYAPIDPCFSPPDELYERFSGSTLGELAYTEGQKSFLLFASWDWAG